MRLLCALSALGLCLGMSGCSSNTGPKLVPADGTVTYQGQPVADATVLFSPTNGPVATGMTDHDGHFTLTTTGRPGAVIGKAQVSITAGAPPAQSEARPKPKTPEESQAAINAAWEKQRSGQQGGDAPKEIIPSRYALMSTSGLEYEVQASGRNHFDIKLE